MKRRRTGNIARLPRAMRDQVNQMIDDGCCYRQIIAWLDSNGHPGFKRNNLTEWKKGGFQEWLELEQRIAEQEKLRELSYEIATANEGCKTQEAAIQIAANFLFRVFLKFDSNKLSRELDMKPAQITTVLNAFSRLNRRSSEMDMIKEYKQQLAEQRKAAAETTVVPQLTPGLTDQGRANIEHHYKIRTYETTPHTRG